MTTSDQLPDPATPFLRIILVGTDGSRGADRAMGWAARLAGVSDATVLAVHILTYDRELVRDLSLDTMRNWRQELERRLKGPWVNQLRELGVPHRCMLVEDDSPALGLIHAADREQTDLIVVGATGRSTFAKRVLGSTSYSLTHTARRPVIVVPANWHQPTAA